MKQLFGLLVFLSLGFIAFSQVDSTGMNNTRMDALIRAEVENVEGVLGGWQLNYGEKMVLVITDENANRMRIFSPIIESSKIDKAEMEKMLVANFHSALDAKYCLSEGFVISIFTHPLRELTANQFIDALRQVVVLNHTFGTTYQSTDLIFPGSKQEETPRVNEKPIKKS